MQDVAVKIDQDAFDKIVAMVAMEVPVQQINIVTGISIEDIENLKATTEFRQAVSGKASEQFEKSVLTNDAWDNVEALALNNVLTVLQWNKDPDFALRAAMVANKANRKNSNNKPLEAPLGARTVVHLNHVFIDKMQQNNTVMRNAKTSNKKKDENFLEPQALEKLFHINQSTEKELLPDFEPQEAIG